MVRGLHTGDCHIGQTLRGYSREYEQAQIFDQLIEIIAERKIDVLIVAGDIFGTGAFPLHGQLLRSYASTMENWMGRVTLLA